MPTNTATVAPTSTVPIIQSSGGGEPPATHPSIDVQKTPDGQLVVTGSTVSFTITVKNTGDVTLTNVRVTDAEAADCARNLGTLDPGKSTSYTCTRANVSASFTNSATVYGTPPTGGDVTHTDTARVDVIHPAIQVAKDPDAQTVVSSGTATFTITVKNVGDATLTSVQVADDQAPGCARMGANNLGTLDPGKSTSYTCTLANVTAGFTNSATASGLPPVGPSISSTDTARVDVTTPSIRLVKEPKTQTVSNGDVATFTITVTNTGATALANVQVSDDLAPGCARTGGNALGALNPGDSRSYTCTSAGVTAAFTNLATATGQPPTGPSVSSSDTARVELAVIEVAAVQAASPAEEPAAPAPAEEAAPEVQSVTSVAPLAPVQATLLPKTGGRSGIPTAWPGLRTAWPALSALIMAGAGWSLRRKRGKNS